MARRRPSCHCYNRHRKGNIFAPPSPCEGQDGEWRAMLLRLVDETWLARMMADEKSGRELIPEPAREGS